MQDLRPFFEAVHFTDTDEVIKYHPLQWGARIKYAFDPSFDIDQADIVLIGCGGDPGRNFNETANIIRKHLYGMYHWHEGVTIADAGNIVQGATINDTRAALLTVLEEVHAAGKLVILLGGRHDLTMQQYEVFKKSQTMAVATVADMLIDLDDAEDLDDRSFLLEMLTGTPNFISHYNHIAFQSYYTQPRMLETLDKLRFDFYRLGKVRENIMEMEPVLRGSDIFSFDISAIRFSDAPANVKGSPNGLSGEEACSLTRFAGMSSKLTSLGIFGYDAATDTHEMTAKQISQMIWYFVDGLLVRRMEADLTDRNEFLTYNVTFTDNDTVFIKSKRTNRWWMSLPGKIYVPCSYNDYITASNNDIPERWLREQERLV